MTIQPGTFVSNNAEAGYVVRFANGGSAAVFVCETTGREVQANLKSLTIETSPEEIAAWHAKRIAELRRPAKRVKGEREPGGRLVQRIMYRSRDYLRD